MHCLAVIVQSLCIYCVGAMSKHVPLKLKKFLILFPFSRELVFVGLGVPRAKLCVAVVVLRLFW